MSWTKDIVCNCEAAEVKIEICAFWLSLGRYFVRSGVGVVGLRMDGVLDCDRYIHHKCSLTAVAEKSLPISCAQETGNN